MIHQSQSNAVGKGGWSWDGVDGWRLRMIGVSGWACGFWDVGCLGGCGVEERAGGVGWVVIFYFSMAVVHIFAGMGGWMKTTEHKHNDKKWNRLKL